MEQLYSTETCTSIYVNFNFFCYHLQNSNIFYHFYVIISMCVHVYCIHSALHAFTVVYAMYLKYLYIYIYMYRFVYLYITLYVFLHYVCIYRISSVNILCT